MEQSEKDKVEILSTEDQKIKSIGELLSNDSSREILKLLFADSLTANQISQKTGISLPLVIYHLKKMQDAEVIKVNNIGTNTKSHDMKFYTADKFAIVIIPSPVKEKAIQSKSLHNSFNRLYRYATIGGAAIAAWFSSQFIQSTNNPQEMDSAMQAGKMMEETSLMQESAPFVEGTVDAPISGEPSIDLLYSVITVLSVVTVGLIIEKIVTHFKKPKHAERFD